jgi:Mg2+ and Co2+ transporter CorA
MKKLSVLLMVVGLFSAIPAFAAGHHDGMKMDATGNMRECSLHAISLSERISNIQKELNDSTGNYNQQELNQLKLKLEKAKAALEDANKG